MIFYAVYQQLESAFLSPRIMKSTVDLSPLAVIIALVLGGTLAGVLGALVSVPTAALVSVFVEEYLVKRKSVPKLLPDTAGSPSAQTTEMSGASAAFMPTIW